MAGRLDPDQPCFRDLPRVAFGIVDRLKRVVLAPYQQLRRPGLEQGRQHLLSIAVVRRARETPIGAMKEEHQGETCRRWGISKPQAFGFLDRIREVHVDVGAERRQVGFQSGTGEGWGARIRRPDFRSCITIVA